MSRFARRTAPATPISEEVATDQVCAFLDYYDFTDEQRKEVEGPLNKLAGYIQRGIVSVDFDKDSKLKLTVNLSDGKTHIDVAELGARHRQAMDRVKAEGNYSRVYALIGSLTGIGVAGVEKLPSQDLLVMETLGVVFLVA